MVTEPMHVAGRPHWKCKACGQPWPCATARTELLTGYHGMPLSLSLYLASLHLDCLNDLYALNPNPDDSVPQPSEVFTRFYGWTVPGRGSG
ncbi:hypothetical protein AB0J90_02845 [Micromonospora sp. NPDC049523]|uniref:hypothetical protein n=1 Tax=Micromonospora sp. NPDC049523 TaxID=3155921 RepID=UPI0034167F12